MKINWKQIEQETGIKLNGILTKDEEITFFDLTPEDETKVRLALETHVAVFPIDITNQEIMNKLNLIGTKLGI